MLLFLISVNYILLTSGQYNYSGWVNQEPSLPRYMMRVAIGYNNNTDTIWLFGGISLWPFNNLGQQLLSFKNGNFTDYGQLYLKDIQPSYIDNTNNQYYTQIDQYVYYRPHLGEDSMNYIHRFNLNTLNFDYTSPPILSLPSYLTLGTCLCSMIDFHQYIIISGGTKRYTNVFFNHISILNLSSNAWLPNTSLPLMNIPRYKHSCIVNNKILYIIGGRSNASIFLNSIEILSLDNDLYNIQNESFIFYNQSLPQRISDITAIIYRTDILLIGGYVYNNDNVSVTSDTIYVIDTLTNKIRIGGYLNIPLYASSIIIVNDIIYSFGGYRKYANGSGEWLDSWRWKDLLPPTISPTSTPTSPTSAPTISPTLCRSATFRNRINLIFNKYNSSINNVLLYSGESIVSSNCWYFLINSYGNLKLYDLRSKYSNNNELSYYKIIWSTNTKLINDYDNDGTNDGTKPINVRFELNLNNISLIEDPYPNVEHIQSEILWNEKYLINMTKHFDDAFDIDDNIELIFSINDDGYILINYDVYLLWLKPIEVNNKSTTTAIDVLTSQINTINNETNTPLIDNDNNINVFGIGNNVEIIITFALIIILICCVIGCSVICFKKRSTNKRYNDNTNYIHSSAQIDLQQTNVNNIDNNDNDDDDNDDDDISDNEANAIDEWLHITSKQ